MPPSKKSVVESLEVATNPTGQSSNLAEEWMVRWKPLQAGQAILYTRFSSPLPPPTSSVDNDTKKSKEEGKEKEATKPNGKKIIALKSKAKAKSKAGNSKKEAKTPAAAKKKTLTKTPRKSSTSPKTPAKTSTKAKPTTKNSASNKKAPATIKKAPAKTKTKTPTPKLTSAKSTPSRKRTSSVSQLPSQTRPLPSSSTEAPRLLSPRSVALGYHLKLSTSRRSMQGEETASHSWANAHVNTVVCLPSPPPHRRKRRSSENKTATEPRETTSEDNNNHKKKKSGATTASNDKKKSGAKSSGTTKEPKSSSNSTDKYDNTVEVLDLAPTKLFGSHSKSKSPGKKSPGKTTAATKTANANTQTKEAKVPASAKKTTPSVKISKVKSAPASTASDNIVDTQPSSSRARSKSLPPVNKRNTGMNKKKRHSLSTTNGVSILECLPQLATTSTSATKQKSKTAKSTAGKRNKKQPKDNVEESSSKAKNQENPIDNDSQPIISHSNNTARKHSSTVTSRANQHSATEKSKQAKTGNQSKVRDPLEFTSDNDDDDMDHDMRTCVASLPATSDDPNHDDDPLEFPMNEDDDANDNLSSPLSLARGRSPLLAQNDCQNGTPTAASSTAIGGSPRRPRYSNADRRMSPEAILASPLLVDQPKPRNDQGGQRGPKNSNNKKKKEEEKPKPSDQVPNMNTKKKPQPSNKTKNIPVTTTHQAQPDSTDGEGHLGVSLSTGASNEDSTAMNDSTTVQHGSTKRGNETNVHDGTDDNITNNKGGETPGKVTGKRKRKPRSDKGVKRGPRKSKTADENANRKEKAKEVVDKSPKTPSNSDKKETKEAVAKNPGKTEGKRGPPKNKSDNDNDNNDSDYEEETLEAGGSTDKKTKPRRSVGFYAGTYCGECSGCLMKECGNCAPCMDRKFATDDKPRKLCVVKRCVRRKRFSRKKSSDGKYAKGAVGESSKNDGRKAASSPAKKPASRNIRKQAPAASILTGKFPTLPEIPKKKKNDSDVESLFGSVMDDLSDMEWDGDLLGMETTQKGGGQTLVAL